MTFKVKDHYFHKAKKENFLARSVYKLEEIDQRFHLIHPGNQVMDFGYYPGSWTQYLSQKVGPKGKVVGVDLQEISLPLRTLSNVILWQRDAEEVENVEELGVDRPFDLVCSDMAPKTTGIRMVDQENSLRLVEKVMTLLPRFLRPNGHVVIKVFESHSAQIFLKEQKARFHEFHYLRPKSTRSCSKEFFVIGKGLRSS